MIDFRIVYTLELKWIVFRVIRKSLENTGIEGWKNYKYKRRRYNSCKWILSYIEKATRKFLL